MHFWEGGKFCFNHPFFCPILTTPMWTSRRRRGDGRSAGTKTRRDGRGQRRQTRRTKHSHKDIERREETKTNMQRKGDWVWTDEIESIKRRRNKRERENRTIWYWRGEIKNKKGQDVLYKLRKNTPSPDQMNEKIDESFEFEDWKLSWIGDGVGDHLLFGGHLLAHGSELFNAWSVLVNSGDEIVTGNAGFEFRWE